ncbi:MAG: rod shape-determining protein MreC [Candidatus Dadabacteria bacterium]|nr:rod shape-determining protein MreC [Candidatus Dadabacteria bacterium]
MSFLRRHPILISIVLFFFATQFISFRLEGKRERDTFSGFILTLTYYPQKLIFVLTGAIVGVWHNYIELIGIREENEGLRNEIRKLRQEKFQLWEAELQNERLKKLLGLKEDTLYDVVSANVIAGSPSILRSQVVIIDKGSKDGISEGMPVATYEGIVGRILLTGGKSSEVILITDEISAVDAYIHRTRARGIVKGTGDGCVMEYIEKKADVSVGDKVISSGRDGFFPEEVVIGTVVETEASGGFIRARVSPDMDLNSLEEVVVILKSPEKTVLNE